MLGTGDSSIYKLPTQHGSMRVVQEEEDSLPLATLALVNSEGVAKEHRVNISCRVQFTLFSSVCDGDMDRMTSKILAFIISS